HPHTGVAEHTHPGREAPVWLVRPTLVGGAPALRCPGHHHIAGDALGVRHHHRETTICRRDTGEPASAAIRVEGILLGGPTAMIDIAQGSNGLRGTSLPFEICIPFAVRDRHRYDGAAHALHEN